MMAREEVQSFINVTSQISDSGERPRGQLCEGFHVFSVGKR